MGIRCDFTRVIQQAEQNVKAVKVTKQPFDYMAKPKIATANLRTHAEASLTYYNGAYSLINLK